MVRMGGRGCRGDQRAFQGGDPNRENKVAGKDHSEWRELCMKAVKKVEFDIKYRRRTEKKEGGGRKREKRRRRKK